MNWEYKGTEIKSINQFPEGTIGFIYILRFSDGKQYIGRKNLYTTRKKALGKKELEKLTDKRKKRYKVEVKESDWMKYTSSNSTIKSELTKESIILESREIIKLCSTAKQMTYYEAQALFCYGVLEYPDQYYNDNILGKFFKRDLSDIGDENNITENQ